MQRRLCIDPGAGKGASAYKGEGGEAGTEGTVGLEWELGGGTGERGRSRGAEAERPEGAGGYQPVRVRSKL